METLFDAEILKSRESADLDITYPRLPISDQLDEIKKLVFENQVVIVAGETGSGKTTQIPKVCLEMGLGRKASICHTQPRRLAARAIASRIASELGVPLGGSIGYAVRFDEKYGEETLVKLMTDGLLLAEISADPELRQYEVVIVDEAHERSLNIDFLLGYLRQLVERRKDLKVIITSATIDVELFSEHFSNAPVIKVGGRGYPIETRYIDCANRDEHQVIIDCIDEISDEFGFKGPARDILIFQPGEREILDVSRSLRPRFQGVYRILPLYARLSAQDQAKIFSPDNKPRIIISTNVAETSLTVPNIGFVIDPGFARVARYSYRSKLQKLNVEPISQASADQRQGRCGRIASGICYRLYTEDDYLNRSHFTDSEIKRTSLAQVVLNMHSMRLGDIRNFPFLEKPDPGAIRDAERLLGELGALRRNRLTKIGQQMSRLPIDPRLSRMLLYAQKIDCLRELLIIVSVLAIQDPRDRPMGKLGSADRAHEKFVDKRSDFMSFLQMWFWYLEQRRKMGSNQLSRELRKNYLSPARMREWHLVHRQLLIACQQLGWRLNDKKSPYSLIHKALLAGSLSFIGFHDEKGVYKGPRGLKFKIFPGSVLSDISPKWVIAGGITETQRVYGRTVASVKPQWIEEAAGNLVKRRFSDPYWSKKRGETLAQETVEIYGLCLADSRSVSYSHIDPVASRELFLADGLVATDNSYGLKFLEHNQNLITELLDTESKERRRDVLISEAILTDLYDARVPQSINKIVQLKAWWKGASSRERAQLFFKRDMLIASAYEFSSDKDYPSEIEVRGFNLNLGYRFSPGTMDDGVSVDVPVGLMSNLLPERFEWSVPGYFPRLVEAWLRTLPKSKRKGLAPIPDKINNIVKLILSKYMYGEGRLLNAISKVIKDEYNVETRAVDWDRQRVPRHLLMNIRVIGESGGLIAQGRDFAVLKDEFRFTVREQLSEVEEKSAFSDFVEFPKEGLSTYLNYSTKNGMVVGYPALVDQGETVSVKLFSNESEQLVSNRRGYARLGLLSVPEIVKVLGQDLTDRNEMGLHFAPLGSFSKLKDELLMASSWSCFFSEIPLPVTAEVFNERVRDRRSVLSEIFDSFSSLLEVILSKRFRIVTKMYDFQSPAFAEACSNISRQLADLVPSDVLSSTPQGYLSELPRYLDGIDYRLDHLQGKLKRDNNNMLKINILEDRLKIIVSIDEANQLDCDRAWAAIQELRLVLFAEGISRGGTSHSKVQNFFTELERSLGLI